MLFYILSALTGLLVGYSSGMPLTTMTFLNFIRGNLVNLNKIVLNFQLSQVVFVLAGDQIQNISTAARVAAAVSVLVQNRAGDFNLGFLLNPCLDY